MIQHPIMIVGTMIIMIACGYIGCVVSFVYFWPAFMAFILTVCLLEGSLAELRARKKWEEHRVVLLRNK
jgi:hypothetical protein